VVRIAVVGLGLIGASLGMALRGIDQKETGIGPLEVVGFDSDPRAVKEARGRLAIDKEARSLAEAVRDAQVVFVAVPVRAVREIFQQLALLLPAGAMVSDVSSTKAQVSAWAAELLPNTLNFVGGHPMAGKEQAGAANADPELFKGAIYCLTVGRSTSREAIDAIESLVRAIGAKPYYIDPEEHDAYVAGISHLPLLLSVALIKTTANSPAWREMAPLAATGFRDVGRLASGDPAMHRDILLTNPTGLTRWINDVIHTLIDLREQINAGDADALAAELYNAKELRDAWLEARPNLRPGEAEFLQSPEIERPNLFTFRMPNRKK
jgi:prephenate dehydrogenase